MKNPLTTVTRARVVVVAMALAGMFVHGRPTAATTLVAVRWTNLVKATASAGSVQKTGGCNRCNDAGATSAQTITAAAGGSIEFTAVAGKRFFVGLGTDATSNADPARINYAFGFWEDGGWDVRESDVYKTDGRFVTGDRFRITVASGSVRYYKNGALIYKSALRTTAPLYLDTRLLGAGAEVRDASISAEVAAPASPAVTLTTISLPTARVDDFYTTSLHATGAGGYQWSLIGGALPPGVSIDRTSGTIQGTPSRGGRFHITVRAADGANPSTFSDRALDLTIVAATPPSTYSAISDRVARAKGPTPVLGGAGCVIRDPAFHARLLRVTDGALQPSAPNISYRTPSSTHTNAWSADARYFYAVNTYGTIVPFAFNPATMSATRLPSSAGGDGGLTLAFFNEPTFSYLTPGVLYGTYSGPGSTLHSVDRYDLETGQYSQLVNLESLAPDLSGTYTGGILASAGATERIMAFFGGAAQNEHFYLLVFDRENPSRRHLMNTLASTIDGQPTTTLLNFRIHAASIDRSGEFVIVYPTAEDLQAPRNAAPTYVWDLVTNRVTPLPLVAAISGGHDGYGFGVRVNQDCCSKTTWDAAQWQFRSLTNPLATLDLIPNVLLPKEIYLDGHPSWHNAQPDRLVPFIDASYRRGDNRTPWRAWDEEIFAVETEGAGGTVWRFAQHRSIVASDLDPLGISFWNTPRANVSPDGRWALFTSNWDKTLGIDPRNEQDGKHRQDVFLVEMR